MSHNFWKTTIIDWEKKRYDSFFSKILYTSLLARQNYLVSVLNQIPAGAKILELGCGSSRVLDFVRDKENIEYIGVDISAEAIEKARQKYKSCKNADWICASIENLKNIKADYVISAGLIDWVSDRQFEDFLKNNQIKYHCHSFSARELTIKYCLHHVFTKIIQIVRKIQYKPRYFSVHEIKLKFSLVHDVKIFRDASLSFGGFVHNLPALFLSEKKSSVQEYFKYKKNNINLFEFFYKKKELKEFLKINDNFSNINVLEIGSGTGFYTKVILNKFVNELVATDAFVNTNNFVKSDRLNFNFKKFENLSLKKEQKIHKIFCIGIIEFVEDINFFLKKMTEFSSNETEIFITLPYKKTVGYFLYKMYHQLINRITLNGLDRLQFEAMLNSFFPNREIQIHSFGYLNIIYHIKKNCDYSSGCS